MIKRFFIGVVAFSACFMLTGCGTPDQANVAGEDESNIATEIYEDDYYEEQDYDFEESDDLEEEYNEDEEVHEVID